MSVIRRPGYGLEADIEQELRDWFGGADEIETSDFTDSHMGAAVDALVQMLTSKGYLRSDVT